MRKDNKGSITVEAALVMPIFILAIMAFVCLFKVIIMQVQLQCGLTEGAEELSQLAYINTAITDNVKGDSENDVIATSKSLAGSVVVKNEIEKYFSKKHNYSSILRNNITYYHSSYLEEGENIDLIAEYRVRIPMPLFHLADFPFTQRVRTNAFTGSNELLTAGDGKNNEKEADGKYVYITETGTVYHVSLECSSLRLHIAMCSANEVSSKRNIYGGKYNPCEKCCKNMTGISSVYICEDGNSYHRSLECSGLKRTIKRVLLSDVENEMRACKRCGV